MHPVPLTRSRVAKGGRAWLAGLVVAVLVATALAATGSTATADVTVCEPNQSWNKLVNRSSYLQIDPSDMSDVYRNGTTQMVTIKENYHFDVASRASRSTSTGKDVNAGVTVGWFNAGAGYQTGTVNAMETSRSDGASVESNFSLEPGQRVISYGGHRFSKAFVYHKRCSSDGKRVITDWSGWVRGPRYPERGWVLCTKTRYC